MRTMTIYRNYNFLTKDPVIDAMRTVIKSTEKLKNSETHALTGVATATFENWFNGKTCKPQNATVSQAMAGLGYVRRDTFNPDGTVSVGFERGRKINRKAEAQLQAAWYDKHHRDKKKKRRKKQTSNGHAKRRAPGWHRDQSHVHAARA